MREGQEAREGAEKRHYVVNTAGPAGTCCVVPMWSGPALGAGTPAEPPGIVQ